MSALIDHRVDRILECLNQYLRLLLLCNQVLLVLDPLLPRLVQLYLGIQARPRLLQHNLPAVIVLFEDLLDLLGDGRPVSVLVRVLLQDREDLRRQLLVVDKGFLDIGWHPRLIALYLVGEDRLVHKGAGRCPRELHLCLSADERAVFVFNRRLFRMHMLLLLLLLLYFVIGLVVPQALLGFKPLPEGVLAWAGTHNDYVGG